MWNSFRNSSDIPAGRDVRLAVVAAGEVHALVFPCRRKDGLWVDSATGRIVDVYPTDWQEWAQPHAQS